MKGIELGSSVRGWRDPFLFAISIAASVCGSVTASIFERGIELGLSSRGLKDSFPSASKFPFTIRYNFCKNAKR